VRFVERHGVLQMGTPLPSYFQVRVIRALYIPQARHSTIEEAHIIHRGNRHSKPETSLHDDYSLTQGANIKSGRLSPILLHPLVALSSGLVGQDPSASALLKW
jgi:hypothetical protein